jgi:hypothetical protein
MTRLNSLVCAGLLVAVVCAAAPSSASAQAAAGAAAAKPPLESLPVQVDVVLTRWQGEKKISSLPFVLIATAGPLPRGGNSTSIRMGVDVPIGTSTSSATQTTGAQGNSPRAVETTKSETVFRNVGTDIDTQVSRTDQTSFSVFLNLRDSSIFSSDASKPLTTISDPTAFRTFTASNSLPMIDGQTRLFGLGTDKVTGETVRVEVKLTILK